MIRLLVFSFLLSCAASAQTASLRGQVTDSSGAVVPGARVVLTGRGKPHTAIADGEGVYQSHGLAAGNYTIQATAAALSSGAPARLTVQPGTQTFDLRMLVTLTTQQLDVQGDAGHAISIDSSADASAVVLQREDLELLRERQ